MKFIIQLVDWETGNRSAEFLSNATQLYNLLKESEELDPKDHILVLASVDEQQEEQHQLEFVRTPIMTIESFMKATASMPEVVDAPNKLNGNAPEEKANG